MSKNAYRDKAKRRLGIREDDQQFDSDLDDFTDEAVNNLYPITQAELPAEQFSLGMNEFQFSLDDDTLSGNIKSVRRLFLLDESLDKWESFDDFTQHDDVVSLYTSWSSGVTLKIEGNGAYTNDTVPEYLDQVILNWIQSEFYSLLVGDKRKYNIYAQTTSARSVDNLRDLSDYYLDRGNQILADRATIRGQ